MVRLFPVLVICCLGRILLAGGAAPAPVARPAPLISARAAVLLDRETGLVLWAYNADLPLPMASTTKIMTAMVILDRGSDRLEQGVTISKRAAMAGGNWVLTAGDTMSLRDMLKAILISSSNQAAEACAEYLTGGHPELFVQWMNDKATDILGAGHHTHFVNPHGLYDPALGDRHYTTAHDLALLARYALRYYPLIRTIVSEGHPPHREPIRTYPRGVLYLENHNRILDAPVPGIPGAVVDGVKTGFVNESGKCLVASATLNGWQLIAVVLGGDAQYFKESGNLLHYGFSRFRWMTYATEQQAGLTVPVARGRVGSVALGLAVLPDRPAVLGAPVAGMEAAGGQDRVVFRGRRLAAPIRRGQPVGELWLLRDGRVINRAPAVALADVPLAWWVYLLRALGGAAALALLVVLLGIAYGTIAKSRRRRRRSLQAQSRGADPGGAHYR